MHLTINEISHLLDTWNGWYLLSHDENFLSSHSDNEVKIIISPFDSKKIDEKTKNDLIDYTDSVKFEDGIFEIDFTFSAYEHQTSDILKALKPVMEKSQGSKLEIINAMRFTEEDLPEEEAPEKQLDDNMKSEIKKFLNKQKSPDEEKAEKEGKPDVQEEKKEKEEINESETQENKDDDAPTVPPLNSICLQGIINTDYIDISEILHNDKPMEKQELFLEASRLYETIERSLNSGKPEDGQYRYECLDESEAALTSLYLGTSLDFGKTDYAGKQIKCVCMPEEIAAAVSFIRYRNEFQLFNNPFLKRLKARKKRAKEIHRELLKKSCSCLLFSFSILLFVLLWLIISRPKH
ncbi:MAG: hypothetical protein LWY06_00860 [Firmicutes bacterium]|nr:hypothetical protein [Bacillota bacterium]